jgi:hypothetical protein
MLLLPILFLGIFLFLNGKRVTSVVIFFFFLSDGFQLVPPKLFNTHLGFDKPVDFCFIYAISLFVFGLLKYENFIPKRDIVGKSILIFLSVICLIMGVNYFVFHVPIKEIIQTGRFFFVLLTYFLFIRLHKGEIEKIHRILFPIVIFQCLLFILQVIISKPILTGYYGGFNIGLPFLRFYNLPLLIYFYVYYALFQNPYSGAKKIASIAILSATLILPMHRGWIVAFLISIALVSYLRGGFKEIAKYLVIASIVLLPAMSLIMSRFGQGDTEGDLNNVATGTFVDYVQDNDNNFEDGTFLFRIAQTYERFMYCQQNPLNMAFGVGFMVEGSPYTIGNLDFKIGLLGDDGFVFQVDTSDIAWCNFVVRFGIVGTVAFLFMFGVLFVYFFRNKSSKDSIPALMFLMLLLFTSANSSQLYYVWMFSIIFLSVATLRNADTIDQGEDWLDSSRNNKIAQDI